MLKLRFVLINLISFSLLPHILSAQLDRSGPMIRESLSPSPYYVLEGVRYAQANIQVYPKQDYTAAKRSIANGRNHFKEALNQCNTQKETDSVLKAASDFFTESLLNDIIPHWYGTTWDYNGYTDIPGDGQVACGYFVSTTLKHCGLNVNRYDLARAYSLKSVKVLHGPNEIDLSGKGLDHTIDYLLKQDVDGFYAVGLDNHIGFLLKRHDQVYFIHSSYIEPVAVCIEPAKNARALMGHNSYVLAQLSGNEYFIRKWVKHSSFDVPVSS